METFKFRIGSEKFFEKTPSSSVVAAVHRVGFKVFGLIGLSKRKGVANQVSRGYFFFK
jgi:hypothetical protein